MNAPTNLKHKPLITVPNYDLYDGQNAKDETDAKALSIGFAQYDQNTISAKIWRRPKDRWSPQSEELPIHRVFDLLILYMSILCDKKNGLPVLGEIVDNKDFSREIIRSSYNPGVIAARIDLVEELIKEFKTQRQ